MFVVLLGVVVVGVVVEFRPNEDNQVDDQTSCFSPHWLLLMLIYLHTNTHTFGGARQIDYRFPNQFQYSNRLRQVKVNL